jgi:hypothetical protein
VFPLFPFVPPSSCLLLLLSLFSQGEINIPLDMLNDDYNDLEIEYPISPSSAEDVTAGEGKEKGKKKKKKKTRGETPNINPNAAPPKPGKLSVVLRHTALGE